MASEEIPERHKPLYGLLKSELPELSKRQTEIQWVLESEYQTQIQLIEELGASEAREKRLREALMGIMLRFKREDEGTLHVRDGVAWAMYIDAKNALAQHEKEVGK
jgi:uncharacterized protein YPO0396